MAVCEVGFLFKSRRSKRKPLLHEGEVRGHIQNQNVT